MKTFSAISFLLLSLFASSVSAKFIAQYEVFASGDQQVPPVETNANADMFLGFGEDLSYFDFELHGYDLKGVIFAHLHCGTAGTNGPVVATLLPPQDPTDYNGFIIQGIFTNTEVTAFDAATCGVIINNVASLYEAVLQRRIYLNIHTSTNQPGELRAQVVAYST